MPDHAHPTRIVKLLESFADGFRQPDGALPYLLGMKWEHSLRVAKDCRDIAGELGWPDGDVKVAETIGLLHDVGRFPQHRNYGTFADHKSVDHGEYGWQTVREQGWLADMPEIERDEILTAVRYHNRKNIPDGLDSRSLKFLRLIRDADKLDIFHVVNEAIRNDTLREYPDLLLNIDLEGGPSPALVREIREHRSGSYQNVRTLTDMHLMRMTWVYDIQYLPALRRLDDRSLLSDLFAVLPADPDISELIQNARRHIAMRMKETI